jgi:dihydrofolate synthase/folylpolyglutamate synthase
LKRNNYTEALEFLYSRLPIYQRIGPAAYKEGLDNIIALCEGMGNPQGNFRTIHIAGTNGKGSVSHYLAAILQCAGYSNVGLHTSPHLKDFRERVKVNGKEISKAEVVAFINKYSQLIEKIEPSFFELSVALAFYIFSERKSEIAVIETGLGGRLDSTNIITPLLSIITNISFDHVGLLGDTIAKIAYEKAGIIKPGVPVVIGESNPESSPVFDEKAKQCGSMIVYADMNYKIENITKNKGKIERYLEVEVMGNLKSDILNLKSGLSARYQQKNILTVIAAVDILRSLGYKINDEHIKKGMKDVIKLTGFKGRWQVLSHKPLVIADIAHNEAGINEVLKQSSFINYENMHLVIGMVNDKEIDKILGLLPKGNRYQYYFCKANIPRALPENELKEKAEKFGLNGDAYPTVKEALESAKTKSGVNDLILVTGSAFVVAEVV